MDKATAEQIVLKQWRALPPDQRQDSAQAIAFAKTLSATMTFETFGNPASIIRSWLVLDLQRPDRFRELPPEPPAPAPVAVSLANLRAALVTQRTVPPALPLAARRE